MGEFPSGQRGQTVNLLAVLSVVRIHHPPPKKKYADVAELADALDLGSSAFGVGVRVPSSALENQNPKPVPVSWGGFGFLVCRSFEQQQRVACKN